MIITTEQKRMEALYDNAKWLLRRGKISSDEFELIKKSYKRTVKSRSQLTKTEQILREISLRCGDTPRAKRRPE